ncbi:MAG: dephospho-CoA kinase [Acidobacteriia bacterium]|nr:dephospho-CoA kinase [Terriglobia bacterium]
MTVLSRTFGLTGGIASGKSTVARFFEELGAKTIDADRLGHDLIQPSLPAYQEVVALFGNDILDSAGAIDRRLLGARVFSDPQDLRRLNAILHPRIIETMDQQVRQYTAEDPGALVLVDAALIYEAGLSGSFLKVLVAWCHPQQQLERLMGKGGLARAEAERRIAAQMPAEEKRRRADYVIDCSGTKENTRQQVVALYPELQGLADSAS